MNTEIQHFFKEFFFSIWQIFEAVTIPGTNLTAADLTIGFLGCSAFILIIQKMIDAGGAVAFRSGEGKVMANQMLFSHRRYYGGDQPNRGYHEGDKGE